MGPEPAADATPQLGIAAMLAAVDFFTQIPRSPL